MGRRLVYTQMAAAAAAGRGGACLCCGGLAGSGRFSRCGLYVPIGSLAVMFLAVGSTGVGCVRLCLGCIRYGSDPDTRTTLAIEKLLGLDQAV
jgi:hypothetical protein